MPTDKPLRAILWLAVSSQEQVAPDKISMEAQEQALRSWAAANHYDIIDILRVDGFSRSESDIVAALQEFRAQGVTAYERLREHWHAQDFDVLAAYAHSRLGRSSTLHSYVVENTVLSGAQIYLIHGGMIDRSGLRFQIAMGGAQSAGEIDQLTERIRNGMVGRMHRGLTMADIPATHRLIRDPNTGKPLRLEVKEELRRLWDDAAKLLLEKVAWKRIELDLYQRFGHVNPETGRPWSEAHFFKLFYGPYTWGIAAKGYKKKHGLWAFDENEPLPAGVIVDRHPSTPVPAVWTGDLAEQIKAELRRRQHDTGRANPKSYGLSGLLVCGSCGRRMSVLAASDSKIVWWRCMDRYKVIPRHCTNLTNIRDSQAKREIDTFLQDWLDRNQPTRPPGASDNPTAQAAQRIEQITADLEALQRNIDKLIVERLAAPDNLRENFTRLLDQASERKAILLTDLEQSRSVAESEDITAGRQTIYNELQSVGLAQFWQQEPLVVNQKLERIMGRQRFIVLDGKIVDIR